jgi:hypothetical protein
MRRQIDPQSLWLLSGIATRLAQTMGIHRESSLQKLPPFEAEIRRRLWWQITILDRRSAQLVGIQIDAAQNALWDTKQPLNVSDSDLSPYMTEPTREREGPTEMLFCAIRTEIGEVMKQVQRLEKNSIVTNTPCVTDVLKLLDEREEKLDQSTLSKLDLSIPLHLMSLYLAKSAILQMRLAAHHPRNLPDKGASLTQADKDKLFELAMRVLAYDNMAYSNASVRGYLWHVGQHFPFEAFTLVLTELLKKTTGDEVDQAWMCINDVYDNHSEFITSGSNNLLHFALGNLTLKAWDKRATAVQRQDRGLSYRAPPTPAIARLRAQRMSLIARTTSHPSSSNDTSLSQIQSEALIYDYSMSMQTQGLDEMSWDDWDSLIQETGDRSQYYGFGEGTDFGVG